MAGDLETGLSIYQEAMGSYTERHKNYHAMYLANLGLIYWMDANLIVLRADRRVLIGYCQRNSRSPPYGRLRAIFLRNRPLSPKRFAKRRRKAGQGGQVLLWRQPDELTRTALLRSPSRIRPREKPAGPREICNSVVANAIETNNKDMLQVARAFEAELALRQGQLAEASRWVEKYQAKPFRPTFRFYMPQLTLIKILLAQDTTDSRHQAADLLDQLHDFLVSIHNIRFRIDTLALQALLHDARGEEPAALESLAQALNLAEPGGFIRLFVDLGPQMADLLKQLVKQNVAVNYIGRILAAFKEDEDRAMQDESDHLTAQSPPLSTQPLVERLTNRELEILNLLGQWLQNKEIAAKLFISPVTVKKHLDNIYGKLNVSGRRQAVEQARDLGILARHKG